MLVSLRKANMLQLVADLLTLCAAGTGGGYGQGGGQDNYGQHSKTGEQCAVASGLLLKLCPQGSSQYLGSSSPAAMLLAFPACCQAKSSFYIHASQLA